jgi:hypothetical protein
MHGANNHFEEEVEERNFIKNVLNDNFLIPLKNGVYSGCFHGSFYTGLHLGQIVLSKF